MKDTDCESDEHGGRAETTCKVGIVGEDSDGLVVKERLWSDARNRGLSIDIRALS